MKISRLVVQTLVVIAIGISFILTFLIFTNNARYRTQPNTDDNNNKLGVQRVVKKRDVYAPSQILWNDNGQVRMVYNNKHNIVSAVQKDMSKWNYGQIKTTSKNDKDKYEKFVNSKDSLQLFYAFQMPLDYYGKILDKKNLASEHKIKFDRILFHVEKRDQVIYLGNDKTHTIYKISVNSGSSERIEKLLRKTDVAINVKLLVDDKRVLINYENGVALKSYSYLVSKQEDNSYISTLLGSNNISTHKSADATTYSPSSYQKLVSYKNNTLNYYNYEKDQSPKNSQEVLDRGLDLVNQINTPLSNAKLAYANWKTKTLVFREYIEGFPTFYKSDFGAVRIVFNKSEQLTQFSNQVIQVPVPSDSTPVRLKSTDQVMADLKAHGFDTKKIQFIDLGYKWEDDPENKEIVHLVPAYFIRVDQSWSSLQELIGVSDQVGGE